MPAMRPQVMRYFWLRRRSAVSQARTTQCRNAASQRTLPGPEPWDANIERRRRRWRR